MEASPYTPPNAESASDGSAGGAKGGWVARIGLALFAGPVLGMIGTVIGMVRAFSTLAENSDATSEALASDISVALISMMIGIGLGFVGLILILVALLAIGNREKWFFWCSVILSIIWCLVIFPYGAIVGIPILILFIVKRAEFPAKPMHDEA